MTPTQRRIQQIRDALDYEKAPGIHTYHQCKCGRMGTRRGKCTKCLYEELRKLSGRPSTGE